MKKFHIREYFKKYDPHPNLIFWISMIIESLKIMPDNNKKVG